MTSLPGLVDNAGCRGAGATWSWGLWKRRGPGVLCEKDWVPGSVENTGSVVFVTTRPKYTKYKRHSLHCFQKIFAIELRTPSFSTARNGCTRGMFRD